MKIHSHTPKLIRQNGFALVATIAILALTVMIALAMTSLATSTTQTVAHSQVLDEARANARLALSQAIAHLQESAGPDTRITAPADSVAGNTGAPRHLIGAWRSWEGLNHDPITGMPIAPDYSTKLISYEESSTPEGRFLGWLISSTERNNAATDPPNISTPSANTVELLSTGTVSSTDDEVHLVPTDIATGSYAYYIQDENVKAHLNQLEDIQALTDIKELSQRLGSHSYVDAASFGFDVQSELQQAISLETLDFLSLSTTAAIDPVALHYHDITVNARGLLTNTSTGGWRRDLSLMSETWSDFSWDDSVVDLPVFSPAPNVEDLRSDLFSPRGVANTLYGQTTNGSIYPWAKATGISMSWNALMHYANYYKKIGLTNGVPTIRSDRNHNHNWNHFLPNLYRASFLFELTATGNDSAGYTPQLSMRPLFTAWNPYNVAMANQGALTVGHFDFSKALIPFELSASIQGGAQHPVNFDRYFLRRDTIQLSFTANRNETFTKAGATRVFGEARNINQTEQVIDPGVDLVSPWNRALNAVCLGSAGVFAGINGNDTVEFNWDYLRDTNGDIVSQISHSWARNGRDSDNVGLRNNGKGIYRYFINGGNETEKLPNPTPIPNARSIRSIASDPYPFLTVNLSLRTIKDDYQSSTQEKIHTKGYFEQRPYFQSRHPNAQSLEECIYVFEAFATNDYASPGAPSFDLTGAFGDEGAGYIGSSVTPLDGLQSMVLSEIPTRPLLSLAELQHFSISHQNQTAPHAFNAIGNSHASAFIPKDDIIGADFIDPLNPVTPTREENYSLDHSYVSNHVFFDDWFFSSITPEYNLYTTTLVVNDDGDPYTKEKVYEEHLTLSRPLRNKQYVPANTVNTTNAASVATAALASEDSWQNIASELEVKGMFNINSTSVSAWKALLMSIKDTSLPYTDLDANRPPLTTTDWKTDVASIDQLPSALISSTTDDVIMVSRITHSGDLNASGGSVTDEQNLLVNPLTMNEAEVEALAENIVEQIQKRGPFLSLSEFINRQLRDDDDELAMAGAIEAALIKLSQSSSNNPYDEIKAAFPEQATIPSDHRYLFPEAAEGPAAYGYPGWARQADILRPIAPILSARGDTFKVRAYGSAQNASTGEKTEVWCEAVVQRKAEYVDSSDNKDKRFNLSTINQRFGRKIEILSFRWLNKSEV